MASEFFNTGGIPAGLAFHRDGSLYVADEGDEIHGVLRVANGQATILVNDFEGQPLNGANDLVFDETASSTFPIPGGHQPKTRSAGSTASSRMVVWSGSTMAWPFPMASRSVPTAAPSTWPRPTATASCATSIGADGAVGAREDFAFLPGWEGPDGMAFDEAGNLYVAHFGGGKVAVFNQSGEMIEVIPVPGAKVTNVAFGGADRRTLVITDVETASIYQTRVDVPGLRLFG